MPDFVLDKSVLKVQRCEHDALFGGFNIAITSNHLGQGLFDQPGDAALLLFALLKARDMMTPQEWERSYIEMPSEDDDVLYIVVPDEVQPSPFVHDLKDTAEAA